MRPYGWTWPEVTLIVVASGIIGFAAGFLANAAF